VLALMVYALPVAAPNSVKGTLTATTVGGGQCGCVDVQPPSAR
jgi:hypothetical protein